MHGMPLARLYGIREIPVAANTKGDESVTLVECRQQKRAAVLLQPFDLSGSPGRARTADLVINSHPLYQLSYRGIAICEARSLVKPAALCNRYFTMSWAFLQTAVAVR